MPPNLIDLPQDAVFHEIASLGYTTKPPDIRFIERIPPDILPLLSAQWGMAHPGRPIRFHLLKQVFVVGEGLVFDKDLNLYQSTVAQTEPALVDANYQLLIEGRRSGQIPLHAGTSLLCGKIGLNNYGHWLIEMLPLAFLCREWIGQQGWGVIVPRVYPWMAGVIAESLLLLGIPASRCISGEGGPRFFEQIVLVTGLTQHAHYYSPLVMECLDAVASQVPAGPAEPVWMSRAGDRRRIADEEALCDALHGEGWHIAHPGQLTLSQQVALGRGAQHMAGVNGAGLTNLVFMPRGGRLTTFMPAFMPDLFFWQLAGQREIAYSEIRCPQQPDLTGATRWDTPLQFSVADALAELRRATAD